MTNDDLAACIVEHIKKVSRAHSSRKVIAISGMDCAGKSTLALAVQQHLTRSGFNAKTISIDDFLVPLHVRARRTPEFMGYFEDAFDYAGLISALQSATESTEETPANAVGIPIVVVEGVFLLRQELRKLWDLAIWLEIEHSLVLERALIRDVTYFGDEATVRQVYQARCHPAQAYHERRDEPRAHAQIIARFNAGAWSVQFSEKAG